MLLEIETIDAKDIEYIVCHMMRTLAQLQVDSPIKLTN